MRKIILLSIALFGFLSVPGRSDKLHIMSDDREIVEAYSVKVDHLEISFVPSTRTFELFDDNEGLLISNVIIQMKQGGTIISTNDYGIKSAVVKNSDGILSMVFNDDMEVSVRLKGDETLSFIVKGAGADSVWLTGRAPLSDRTMGCLLQKQSQEDNNTVVQTLGLLDVPGISSIFDPLKDLAIELGSDGTASWKRNYQWELTASSEVGQTLCTVQLHRHYYRDTLGITYYAPIRKRSYFQKAPALAMTWVGIEGKYNRPDFSQRKEWLYPNIEWVSENLLPYAEEMIFQLDDNYPIDDPQYMRDISDFIRSKNLIPGIWIAPFGVAPYQEEQAHPDWFIHKDDGSPITTFSGLSYDDVKHYSSTVLNVNSDEGVEKWFAGFLKQVNNEWHYDYYKVDGIPAALTVYKQSVDGGGVEGVRRGLQIFRDVVGADKYINTCWGLPLEGIDIVNGSRVGGDTEQENQVVSSVAIAQNYLNNVAWYSDPDGAANMYASTPARARLNFQSRALLGQPYVTDDNWTKVPDEILFVWQRTLPTIESFPTNLYKISDPDSYDHLDLKIKKSWAEWDVVGLNNYENKARQMILDLARLPLESDEVFVYDFWNQKYLGKHSLAAKIPRNMEAIDAQCFSVVSVEEDRPVLISTSRHFTQGGIDLVDVELRKAEDGESWWMEGKSEHLVSNDPYDLIFVSNDYDLTKARVSSGTVSVDNEHNGLIRARIVPNQNELNWTLFFTPDEKASISFGAEEIHLIPGETAEIPVILRNTESHKWKVTSPNKNIKIREDYSRSSVQIEVGKDIVGLDSSLSTELNIEDDNEKIFTGHMEVKVQGAVRENIAGQAKAFSSSVYFQGDQNGYGRPEGVNDGRTFRAWEAAEGEKSGWIELIWEKPVTFQRLVIDEWMESGGEIKSWKLEAGDKKYEYTPRGEKEAVVTYDPKVETSIEIARGGKIGRGFVIELKKPVTANMLRLNIIEASDRPGIWEIKVNPPDHN